METYQIRTRLAGDLRDWQEIPIITRSYATITEAHDRANRFARDPRVYEVRMNILGSQQGHYTPGPTPARARHRALVARQHQYPAHEYNRITTAARNQLMIDAQKPQETPLF